jgi:hypothetical protein
MRKGENHTSICESIIWKMWEPRRLIGPLACYRDSFTSFYTKLVVTVSLCHNRCSIIKRPHYTCYPIFYVTEYFVSFQVSVTSVISRGRWLLFSSPSSIDSFFSNIKIPYDCEFLVTQPLTTEQGREISLSLIEIYQDHPTRSLQKQPVANWTSSSGLIWSASPLLQRRGDLHGISIRVGLTDEVNNGQSLNLEL